MKTFIAIISIFFITILNSNCLAQGFEGIIKWKMEIDITDPKTKEKLSKADNPDNKQKMSDANKQMMEKMNDPEFKKMMDQNPQMKEQMEKAMAAMAASSSGGGQAVGLAPQPDLREVAEIPTVADDSMFARQRAGNES